MLHRQFKLMIAEAVYIFNSSISKIFRQDKTPKLEHGSIKTYYVRKKILNKKDKKFSGIPNVI